MTPDLGLPLFCIIYTLIVLLVCSSTSTYYYSRLKPKNFYSLNQSVLIHLLSKILAFLAFIAFKGLKRPKKAEKKTFAKWLRIVQFGEKSNKKNFPSQIFFELCDLGDSRSLTLVAFFWEKSGFWGSRKLVLKKARVSTVWFLARCSLLCTNLENWNRNCDEDTNA